MSPAATPPDSYRSAGADPDPDGDAGDDADVPVPTLLVGMLTAVAAGGFVAWALLPLETTVVGLPLYAVAAVATTLWSGISFLRRKLAMGVLAEGFYLMAVATLARPVAALASLDGLLGLLDKPAGLYLNVLLAVVVGGALLVAGWRLDTQARKARVRRMRRRVRNRMSNKRATDSSLGGNDGRVRTDER